MATSEEMSQEITDIIDSMPESPSPNWFRERLKRVVKKASTTSEAQSKAIKALEAQLKKAQSAPAAVQVELDAANEKLADAANRIAAFERGEIWRAVGLDADDDETKRRRELIEVMHAATAADVPFAEYLETQARAHPALASFLPAPVVPLEEGTPPDGDPPAPVSPEGAPPVVPARRPSRSPPVVTTKLSPDQIRAEHKRLRSEGKLEEAKALRRQHSGS